MTLFHATTFIFFYRTDLPRYIVYRNGHIVENVSDLNEFESAWDDYVSFYLGCSLAFETALVEGGVELGYGKNESLYTTNITLHPVGPFEGKMIVYKCMIAKDQLKKAFMISSRFPDYHGAPVHIGDPTRIGISNTESEDFPVKVRDGDVPIFWGCGMTVQEVISSSSKLCNIKIPYSGIIAWKIFYRLFCTPLLS